MAAHRHPPAGGSEIGFRGHRILKVAQIVTQIRKHLGQSDLEIRRIVYGLLQAGLVELVRVETAQAPLPVRQLTTLPIEEKESYRWLQAFEQTLDLALKGVEVITVCDREADIYEMFAFAHKQQAPLLVRASSNRALPV